MIQLTSSRAKWGVHTSLYTHQEAAVAKLIRSRVGALFMEMGTGKTRTAIEFARLRQHRVDHVIWVCPVSLKATIEHEIRKHTSASIYVFNDRTTLRTLPPADFYVVGIESISSSKRVVVVLNHLVTDRSFLIVDESSYIKGHKAVRTRRITQIGERARYRMILTGTPLSQGVVDLYAQMRFLSPEILGYRSFYSFARKHLEYSEQYPGMIIASHDTNLLAAKTQPYVYQVMKDECMDLPPKIFDVRCVEMTSVQKRYYSQAKDEILLGLQDEDFTSYAIFRLFTALQQIASGFWNRRPCDERGRPVGVPEHITFSHNRIDHLVDVVQQMPSGAQVIIWCKFRHSLDEVSECLSRIYGVDEVTTYHGGFAESGREAEKVRFQQGARFFVAMLGVGSHGLTLNEAHHVVFYENGFKYAQRQQAEDRNHRIGQSHTVTYVDLEAACGIDQRIRSALAEKGDAVALFRQEVERIKDEKRPPGDLLKKL